MRTKIILRISGVKLKPMGTVLTEIHKLIFVYLNNLKKSLKRSNYSLLGIITSSQ